MRKAAPGVAKHETSLLHPAFARTAACDEEKSGTRRSASDDESTDGIAGNVFIHTVWCDLSSPKESEVLATYCSNGEDQRGRQQKPNVRPAQKTK